jgi:hypothetical protein
MRITATAAVTFVLAGSSQSAQKVQVYVNTNNLAPPPVVAQAKGVSSRMFASAGVAIEWRSGEPPSRAAVPLSRTIVMEFKVNTPPDRYVGAVAYALVYEGIHIAVFWDRIQALSPDNSIPRSIILAHVLTHEITHVIQGIKRHSATGVMKTRWEAIDYLNMTRSPLPFASEDIDLIHSGLRRFAPAAAGDRK